MNLRTRALVLEKSEKPVAAKVPEREPEPERNAPSNHFQKLGNQAAQKLLAVAARQGPEERQAERQAERVMENTAPERAAEPIAATRISRQSLSGSGDDVPPEVPNPLAGLGPGRPLNFASRSFFENRFQQDLGGVRVYVDGRASAAARALEAAAFTVGENVVFASGRYRPDSSDGLRLLAHELSHVVQQRASGEARIQRQPGPGDETVMDFGAERQLVLVQRPSRGEAELRYRGRVWMIFRWDPAPGRQLDGANFAETPDNATATETIAVQPSFSMNAEIDLNVEQYAADFSQRPIRIVYDFRFHGSVVESGGGGARQTLAAPLHQENRYTNRPLPRAEGEGGERVLSLPGHLEVRDPSAPQRPRRQTWTVADTAAFNDFARRHPTDNWAGIVTENGQYIAYALTREAVRRMAENVRRGNYNFEILQDYPNMRIGELWLRGTHLDSVNDLRNLYFDSGFSAARGSEGESQECEVFGMEGGLYGRKPLTHLQALDRWAQLDALTADQIQALETEPGRRFGALQVRGAGEAHYLDFRYFRGRDALLSAAASNPDLTIAEDSPEMDYLLVEVDREREDPRVRALLRTHSNVLDALQTAVYNEVVNTAQRITINSVSAALRNYDRLATDPSQMAQWILRLPAMSTEERTQALAALGLRRADPGLLLFMARHYHNILYDTYFETLGDRLSVRRIALGVDVNGVTLASLQEMAAAQREGLQHALDLLNRREVIALRVEGDMGLEARRSAYRAMGFVHVQPNTYPHQQETRGILPGPLSSGTFTDLAEQLYANKTAHMDHAELFETVAKVTAMIAVTVALILIANAAGAALAAAIFGSAATGFSEVVLSAAVFTALSSGVEWAITGRPPIDPNDPAAGVARLGGQFLLNVAMFGFFRMLNTIFAAAGRAGARALFGLTEEGFALSRAAQATARGIQLTATGAAFVTSSLAEFRLANGRWPNAREAGLLVYQSLATLVLLEIGGAMARPYMEQLALWQRARRLGVLNTEIEQHFAAIARLNTDIAALAESPQTAARDARSLLARQQALLQQQRDLVLRLKAEMRTRGDAAVVDAESAEALNRIDTALSILREVGFLESAGIRPVGDPTAADDYGLNFTFRRGAEPEIIRFYGERNVHRNADGSMTVTHEGRTLTFTPEPVTPAAPAQAAGGQGTAAAAPPVTGQQLAQRQAEVLARAERLGIGQGAAVEAIRRLQPGRVSRPATLRQQGQLIGAAERSVEQQARTLGRDALRRHSQRLQRSGQSMANVRTGRLAELTDAQVGEALAQLPPGLQGLSEAQLRGVLYASQPPPSGSTAERISIRRILDLARSADERNSVLDTFGRMMESRTPGTYDVLSSMTANANNWRGGAWMFEFAAMGGRLSIAAFEVTVSDPTTGAERRYDILLTDGTRLEMKDWSNWFPDSLRSQFRRDVLLATRNFADPAGISKVRWIFRPPGPQTAGAIRATMREALDDVMNEFNVNPRTRADLIRAFEAHTDLVTIPTTTRTAVPLQTPPSVTPFVPVLPLRRDDQPDAPRNLPMPPPPPTALPVPTPRGQ